MIIQAPPSPHQLTRHKKDQQPTSICCILVLWIERSLPLGGRTLVQARWTSRALAIDRKHWLYGGVIIKTKQKNSGLSIPILIPAGLSWSIQNSRNKKKKFIASHIGSHCYTVINAAIGDYARLVD